MEDVYEGMADHDTWKALHKLTNLTTKLILNTHLDHLDKLQELSDEDLRQYLKESEEVYDKYWKEYMRRLLSANTYTVEKPDGFLGHRKYRPT